MSLVFQSKAKTLEALHGRLKHAKTLPVFRFTQREYEADGAAIIAEIQKRFEGKIAVRSSCLAEDSEASSNAGAFESVLDVNAQDADALCGAIRTVFASYGRLNKEDEVFIQPMLGNVRIAGVAFTADVSTLAPYYIINYDESGGTDGVTSGRVSGAKTYILYRYYEYECDESNINIIVRALKELELLFTNKFLDVEFALDTHNDIYILQVRAIVVKGKTHISADLTEGLYKVSSKIEKLQKPQIELLGGKAIFGVMPDWNPAEIIGVKPKKLSLSLYKELITDNIWAVQRNNYGYRDLRSHPLLVSFMGVPYIDVRVDFNSFIPKSLDGITARKLAQYYLDKLYKSPKLHDKVEFEIVYSCYDLETESKLTELKNYGFSAAEIESVKQSLLELTNNILCPGASRGLYETDIKKIETLITKHNEIADSDISVIEKIYWLIEECKRYGTLPFSGIARCAFIAAQFLKSFVGKKIIGAEDYDAYMNSLNTVAKQMNRDLALLAREDFLIKWGHIRPGTYDITSPRYDEAFESYFSAAAAPVQRNAPFAFSAARMARLDRELKESGIKTDAEGLLAFIKSAIENREYSKFVFTKSLSYALLLIERFAARFGIGREDAAYLDISLFKDMYASLDCRDVGTAMRENIYHNKYLYEFTKSIKLPALILDAGDIYGFFIEEDEPNFITLGSIRSDVVLEKDIIGTPLAGKIVFIKSADPGYDFLFTKNIGALVTQFGGANSHMTVRCAELGLPAVIGAGEKNFNLWARAETLEINCANKQVRSIK